MLVIIESPPGSEGAVKGIELCRDHAADIVLRGEAVGLAAPGAAAGFCGTVYVLREELEASGLEEYEKGIKLLSTEKLEELIRSEGVLGTF